MDDTAAYRRISWRSTTIITAGGALISLLVAWADHNWLTTVYLGTLLSLLAALLWQTATGQRSAEPSLLETPFHLAHDADVFDRYRRLAQELCRVSGRPNPIYRDCALDSLDALVAQVTTIGDGQIIFHGTESWRLVYERLLRDPSVTVYRSVAWVRDPAYWQDGAGSQSMQLNFELISKSVITIERTLILADHLWPTDADLPDESIRQWIHEQSVQGIWIRLVRESALRLEPDLLRDMGIYGFSAVGYQEFAADQLRTTRFLLDFDFTAVREAEERWNKLNVYAPSYRDLLDQFHLTE